MEKQNVQTLFSIGLLAIVSIVGYAYFGDHEDPGREEYLYGFAFGLAFTLVAIWTGIRYEKGGGRG